MSLLTTIRKIGAEVSARVAQATIALLPRRVNIHSLQPSRGGCRSKSKKTRKDRMRIFLNRKSEEGKVGWVLCGWWVFPFPSF